MAELKIYSVSDQYIKYLRQDERLTIVFDNKEGVRSHTRKYLGVAFVKNDFHYFIPFSSPKNSDYQIQADGSKTIRKSIVQKEFDFIRANEKMIMKNANVLYNQKTKADILYKDKPTPKYLSSTVDFLYDEVIKKIIAED